MAEAMQAVGHVVQGISSYETGKYNRDAANNQAIMSEREGAARELQIRNAARAQIGAQVAAQAGNGMQIGSGSALDALTESNINATVDALAARRKAALDARTLRAEGKIAMAAGENALVQSQFNIASDMAGARADWASARSGQSGGGRSVGGGSGIVVNSSALTASAGKAGF